MKRLIVALAVMLFYGLPAALESQGRPSVSEVLRESLRSLDTEEFLVPLGTPKDEACQAFWRLSAYQEVGKRYKEGKVKDPPLAKEIGEDIARAAERAMELLQAKMEATGSHGCGGTELPDDYIIGVVREAMPKRTPPARLARQEIKK